jgi:hypothetical protein
LADQSYRVAGLISVEWRADLTVASSIEDAPLSPTVQLKMQLDTKPEIGKFNPNNASQDESNYRVKEVAFEMSSDKLDVLVKELSEALILMESVGQTE